MDLEERYAQIKEKIQELEEDNEVLMIGIKNNRNGLEVSENKRDYYINANRLVYLYKDLKEIEEQLGISNGRKN